MPNNGDTEKLPPPATDQDGSSLWLHDHLKEIEARIKDQAKGMAQKENRNVEPRDIASAAMIYAPGKQYLEKPDEQKMTFLERIALSITGVTLMSGLLAIAFGLIGLFAYTTTNIGDPNQRSILANGAWDIAKIFAGAIVGSTSAVVASSDKRDR